MRDSKRIDLGGNQTAIVSELLFERVREIHSKGGISKNPVMDLLGENTLDAEAIIGDCIELPGGKTLNDLTGSELEAVISGLIDVNAPFFRLAGLASLLPAIQSILSPTLTNSGADSSNSAIEMLESTAGDSLLD